MKQQAKRKDLEQSPQKRGIPSAFVLVVGLMAINVLVFALNLYISNHCFYVPEWWMLKTLYEDGNLGYLWMEDGYLDTLDLIFDGPMVDMGMIMFGLNTDFVFEGHHLYSIFTCAFFHADLFHLLSNMMALGYYAYLHFPVFGKREFITWYIGGILGGSLAILATAALTDTVICAVGASGAIFGILGGRLSPIVYLLLHAGLTEATLSVRQLKEMGMQIAFYLFFFVIVLLPGFFEENVSWEGHLGGLIGGLVLGVLMYAWHERKGGAEE